MLLYPRVMLSGQNCTPVTTVLAVVLQRNKIADGQLLPMNILPFTLDIH
jgi:hypothetical protein